MCSPLRLGVSTSSFLHMMPAAVFSAMRESSRTGMPHYLDERLNDLMASYTADIMHTVNTLSIESVECYHSTLWDGGRLLDVMMRNPNVEFWSAHASYGRWIDPSSPIDSVRRDAVQAYCDSVEMAGALGAGIVVVHPGTRADYDSDRQARLELCVDSLRRVAKYALERGIRIAVEPMPKDEPGNSLDQVLWIIESIGEENVGVNFDVNHVFPAADVPRLIRQAGELILSVHISDQDDSERHWLPFEGKLDWPEVLSALSDVGYRGPLIYETHVRGAGSCLQIGEIIVENYVRLTSHTS